MASKKIFISTLFSASFIYFDHVSGMDQYSDDPNAPNNHRYEYNFPSDNSNLDLYNYHGNHNFRMSSLDPHSSQITMHPFFFKNTTSVGPLISEGCYPIITPLAQQNTTIYQQYPQNYAHTIPMYPSNPYADINSGNTTLYPGMFESIGIQNLTPNYDSSLHIYRNGKNLTHETFASWEKRKRESNEDMDDRPKKKSKLDCERMQDGIQKYILTIPEGEHDKEKWEYFVTQMKGNNSYVSLTHQCKKLSKNSTISEEKRKILRQLSNASARLDNRSYRSRMYV